MLRLLSPEVERKAVKFYQKIKKNIIAHRLSTIVNSDRLMVLRDGKIAEGGPPDQLLKDKDSYFYKVYNIREN